MKEFYYIVIFILTINVAYSQEKLSKEEQARREKNIQAGNPFAEFGYDAKVATLSNGKYLEFHDLDSIVTIGTVRFHVEKEQIVGSIQIDSLNPDAQPIGDVAGRWIAIDPLSEEFSNWSPYTMSFNNPIQFVDPDGRAADDWRNALGQLVYDPKANGGKGDYTKYATKDDKLYGDELRYSGPTGKAQFDFLVSSESQDIQVEFLPTDTTTGGFGYFFGKTTNDVKTDENGLVTEVSNTKIQIFKGTAETYVNDINNGTVNPNVDKSKYQIEDEKTIKNNNLTAKDVITATFGHEIGHTTKNNAALSKAQEKNPSGVADPEMHPQKINSQILKDLAN